MQHTWGQGSGQVRSAACAMEVTKTHKAMVKVISRILSEEVYR